jgi:hypothetical protein
MFHLFNLLASVDILPTNLIAVIVLELSPFTKEIKRLSEFYLKKSRMDEKRTIIKNINARHWPTMRMARKVCLRPMRGLYLSHISHFKLWLTQLLSADPASAPTDHGTGSSVLKASVIVVLLANKHLHMITIQGP